MEEVWQVSITQRDHEDQGCLLEGGEELGLLQSSKGTWAAKSPGDPTPFPLQR